MRASEIFNLTWDRVDWQKMAIKLEADDARNAYQKLAE